MDHDGYIKAGGDEFKNKYGAKNPYYGGVKQEMKDGTTNKEESDPNDFWAKTKQPTQEEIIAHNRKENEKKEEESTTVTVEKKFLEKLKDFNYWKEWKNQG